MGILKDLAEKAEKAVQSAADVTKGALDKAKEVGVEAAHQVNQAAENAKDAIHKATGPK